MDRFHIDDVEDEYDAVEPMRPSSFDMSFTLSASGGDGGYPGLRRSLFDDAHDDDAHDDDARFRHTTTTASRHFGDHNDDAEEKCQFRSTTNLGRCAGGGGGRGARRGLLHDQGRLDADERSEISALAAQLDAAVLGAGGGGERGTVKVKTTSRRNVASIAERLEEKAQETIQMTNLLSKMGWKRVKRMQDVHIYRPAKVSEEDAGKVIFRVSCEVKANLTTVMEYLSPRESKHYFDIEAQVFPGLLHASVIKKMDIPTRREAMTGDEARSEARENKENSSPQSTQDPSPTTTPQSPPTREFPHLQVKWHASRFAGRFVKPVDFFFVEYSNIDTLPDGRQRGYGYVRSVESFKGDELATRLNSEKVVIPPSVSKCKRAVINKGIFTVTPVAHHSGAAGSYEVTLMMVIDFQEQFSSNVGQRIVNNFTSRLMGIRELLYKTLFQPVNLLSKTTWKDSRATHCTLCRAQFSIVKPRHHCRSCGEPVCGQCSRKWVVQPGMQKDLQTRLCTSCSLQARSFLRPEAASPRRLFSSSQIRAPPTTAQVPMAPASDQGFRPMDSAGPSFRSTVRMPHGAATAAATHAHDVFHSDVIVGSVVASEKDTDKATRMAFASLLGELGGRAPHFMMISYSPSHRGEIIYSVLADIARDTLFMGGTSNAGVFSEAGAVDQGPCVGLWGIYDPEGSYAVLNANLESESPRDATRRCILEGMELLCMEPEDSPDFVWMNLAAGCEEDVVRTLNEVIDCSFSIVGGGSYVAPTAASRSRRRGLSQICSEGGESGCVTANGLCFAICSPSVEVTHAFFTSYEAKDKSFVVSKATGREIQTLDHKPAFPALNDGCHGMLHEFVQHPDRYNVDHTKLPLYYPLGRQRHDTRTAKLSRFQVIQPTRALPDGSMVVGCEVRTGEKLRMMSVSAESIEERMVLGFREALRANIPVIEMSNVVGCLLNVSVNYVSMLNNDVSVLARATARAFKNGKTLGSISGGQQGVLLCTTEAIHANAMISALLFTNRKKAIRLNPLRPVLLRRYSTY